MTCDGFFFETYLLPAIEQGYPAIALDNVEQQIGKRFAGYSEMVSGYSSIPERAAIQYTSRLCMNIFRGCGTR